MLAANPIHFTNNPELDTPKAPAGWQGTPMDGNGHFVNEDVPFDPKLLDVLRWKCEESPFKAEKRQEKWNPELYRDSTWLYGTDDIIVWLGHSSFYIRLAGLSIITDPVFGDIFPIKRQSEFPVDVSSLTHLNFVLLSHDHRDHMDKESLKTLSKLNPDARYLTGLGMKELTTQMTGSSSVEEAGWYQQYTNTGGLNVTFVPSRHWGKRGLTDTNKRLWGGFVIEGNGKRILFGGDSGYGPHFERLGDVFGGFDYVILGIGAYEPKWFMSANHQSPEEAVQAFVDLKARFMIPMHYGTFDLSDEPMGMPLLELKKTAGRQNLDTHMVIAEIGRPVEI